MAKVMAVAISIGVAACALAIEPGLYGVQSTWETGLYRIDEGTGEATLVSAPSNNASCAGASFLGGELYCTDVLDDDYRWTAGTFDLPTGAYTPISDQDISANWHGLASSDEHGVCWSVDADAGNILKSLAPDGTTTTIGPAGHHGRGMAYDDTHGILYAVGFEGLYTVDILTGASTLIGDTGISADLIGLAYDESTQTLYANEGRVSMALYTLDTTTGAATLVGYNNVNWIDGLAWIPEPGSLSLLAIGVLPMLRRR